jgi:hypothetical protein
MTKSCKINSKLILEIIYSNSKNPKEAHKSEKYMGFEENNEQINIRLGSKN